MNFLKICVFALSLALTVIASPCTTHMPYSIGDKYIVTLIQLNWHAAYAFCDQSGWELLHIQTAEDQFELETFLNYFNLQNETFWTSGNNLADLHSFRWNYNGPYFDYTNWAFSQPDNYMGREHCVRLIEHFTQWDDFSCEKSLHFICQRY